MRASLRAARLPSAGSLNRHYEATVPEEKTSGVSLSSEHGIGGVPGWPSDRPACGRGGSVGPCFSQSRWQRPPHSRPRSKRPHPSPLQGEQAPRGGPLAEAHPPILTDSWKAEAPWQDGLGNITEPTLPPALCCGVPSDSPPPARDGPPGPTQELEIPAQMALERGLGQRLPGAKSQRGHRTFTGCWEVRARPQHARQVPATSVPAAGDQRPDMQTGDGRSRNQS